MLTRKIKQWMDSTKNVSSQIIYKEVLKFRKPE